MEKNQKIESGGVKDAGFKTGDVVEWNDDGITVLKRDKKEPRENTEEEQNPEIKEWEKKIEDKTSKIAEMMEAMDKKEKSEGKNIETKSEKSPTVEKKD